MKLSLAGDKHGVSICERFGRLVFEVVPRITTLGQCFPVVYYKVVSVASSMNITSVKGVIIDLLNARCFVIVAVFQW